jgi:hypothetical protein
MSENKKESFFWTSYSDLMTSLFFVMLVLFVLVIVLLHNKINEQAVELEQYRMVDTTQYKFLIEAEQSIRNIDKTYFEYDETYKRHTFKNIDVAFRQGSSNISDIRQVELDKLKEVGTKIKEFVQNATKNNLNIKYLLIIEGQASKDTYPSNYELSYERAFSLIKFWKEKKIEFSGNCEVLIAGSGDGKEHYSPFREKPEQLLTNKGKLIGNPVNQRFVIHIIPKTGVIHSNK